MAKGKKTGGRKKGTPNKATADIEAKLTALGCDPIEGLARIANGEPIKCGITTLAGYQEVEVRPTLAQQLKARAELAEYVAPKRKAVEHSGSIGSHEDALGELEELDEQDDAS